MPALWENVGTYRYISSAPTAKHRRNFVELFLLKAQRLTQPRRSGTSPVGRSFPRARIKNPPGSSPARDAETTNKKQERPWHTSWRLCSGDRAGRVSSVAAYGRRRLPRASATVCKLKTDTACLRRRSATAAESVGAASGHAPNTETNATRSEVTVALAHTHTRT